MCFAIAAYVARRERCVTIVSHDLLSHFGVGMPARSAYGRPRMSHDRWQVYTHYKNVRGPKQHPKYFGAHFGVPAWDLGVRLGLFGDRFETD